MNRLIFLTAALSLVFTIVNTQSVSENSDVGSENVEDSTINTEDIEYEPTSYLADNVNINSQDEIANGLSEMMALVKKYFTDMTAITEDMKALSNMTNIDEASLKNFVDSLINYVEDKEMVKQKINHVMEQGDQYQYTILKNLESLQINTEDAKKIEDELRKQINLRLPNIPTSQNIMGMGRPSMQNILKN